MKVPLDLTTTILRYKLDPGEPGVLKSATPGQSAAAVTNQELGNLRDFTGQAARRGDTVVFAKVSYSAAIVDGKLSIKAGHTEVYSVPSAVAARGRLDRELSSLKSAEHVHPLSTAEQENSPGDSAARAPETTRGLKESESTVSSAPSGKLNTATAASDQSQAAKAESKKLSRQADELETRLNEIRRVVQDEKRKGEAIGNANVGANTSVEVEQSKSREKALLEKEIADINRRIAMIRAERAIHGDNKTSQVAMENVMSQASLTQAAGFVNLASGGMNAVV